MNWVRRCVVAVLAVTGLTVVGSQPVQADEPTLTSVTMANGPIGAFASPEYRRWYTGSGDISVTGSVTDGIEVHVAGGTSGGEFILQFRAKFGESLVTGQYDRSLVVGDLEHPTMRITQLGDDDLGGCTTSTVRSSFTVLDIAPDLGRLAIRYQLNCGPVVGEIRINEPQTDTDMTLLDSQLTWPDTYPGAESVAVPVHVVDTGTTPLTFTGAAITAGSSDFVVRGDYCVRIDVGEACEVRVAFDPSRPGVRHGTLKISDSSAAGFHTVPLRGVGISGHTTFTMRSQNGDWVGAGEDYNYSIDDTPITVDSDSDAHLVRVLTPEWSAEFLPGAGKELTAGTTYQVADSASYDPALADLSVGGHGRGCSVAGSFTVHEAEFDVDGLVTRFSASFEQHCQVLDDPLPPRADAALFGSVSYRAHELPPPLPPRITVRADSSNYAYGDTATVTGHLRAGSRPGPSRSSQLRLRARSDWSPEARSTRKATSRRGSP